MQVSGFYSLEILIQKDWLRPKEYTSDKPAGDADDAGGCYGPHFEKQHLIVLKVWTAQQQSQKRYAFARIIDFQTPSQRWGFPTTY